MLELMQKAKVEYIGSDLESMDLAVNYRNWIRDVFEPYLGRNIVEVGAGTGSFSKLLLQGDPENLTLIEPSDMFARLTEEIDPAKYSTDIRFFNGTFTDAVSAGDLAVRPDTIVYINVLEHVENDVGELAEIREALADHGKICIFVPAIPFLLSDFDRMIGHFRRYSRRELISKTEKAGFRVILARGFDIPGVFPWLLKYRLMRSVSMEPSMVNLYDRVFIPLIRLVEDLIKPPIGKNLVLVAEKTGV
jgi:SAM-dependent methyltransferase